MEIKKTTRVVNLNESNFIKNSYEKMRKPFVLFDIETTGFDRTFSHISVIGAIYCDFSCDTIELFQFFSENTDDEINVINAFKDFIGNDSILITFNGNSFDIPYLISKSSQFGIDPKFLDRPKLDLYLVAKSIFQDSKHLNLKTIEKMLGISRNDTISGLEAANAYKQYLKTRDCSLRDMILLHNEDDIFNMLGLLRLIELNENYVIPANICDFSTLGNVNIKASLMTIEMFLDPNSLLSISDTNMSSINIDFLVDYTKNKMEIKVPLTKANGIIIINPETIFNLSFSELPHTMRMMLIIRDPYKKQTFPENISKFIEYLLSDINPI